MKWQELMNQQTQIVETGCVRCDGLRKATNNRVRWCLRHDPTITQEWRLLNRIPLEPLPKKEGA